MSRAVVLFAIVAGACATANPRVSYEAKPNADGSYAITLHTRGYYDKRRESELTRQASATCGGAYTLADLDEIIQVCSDDCDMEITTRATLTCKAHS